MTAPLDVEELLAKAHRPSEEAMRLHPLYRGKLEVTPKCPIGDLSDFAVWYTPGVAAPCRDIEKHPEKVFEHTNKGNAIAIISDGTRVLVSNGPYRLAESDASRLVAIATTPDASIRRVRERRFARPDLALRALRSGEVAMLEGVPPWEVSVLKAEREFRMGRDPVPRTHVLALDGRVPALRNRSLRRGMSYAIARQEILEEILLRHRPAPPDVPAEGVIVPGVQVSLDGLLGRAAKLTRIELVEPPQVIGRNTPHAMQSGIVHGYASLVDGLVDKITAELGYPCHVIATGGLSALIAPHAVRVNELCPDLTLDGLRLIYEKNRRSGR